MIYSEHTLLKIDIMSDARNYKNYDKDIDRYEKRFVKEMMKIGATVKTYGWYGEIINVTFKKSIPKKQVLDSLMKCYKLQSKRRIE